MTEGADHGLPSLDLVRRLTDRRVLEQLITAPELTRAEIAARTGISKPTVSESVRRLLATGRLVESGRQVGKRGPAGTFYRLPPDRALALALSAGPEGVVVETSDVRGTVLSRVERPVEAPIDAARLGPVLVEAVRTARSETGGEVGGWALSVAGPVDQDSGRLVRLPHSPFLLDELDPRALVGDLVPVELRVDNDVNWAALAEHHDGNARDLDDLVFCYLGAGVGAAVVADGAVVHGRRGLAGELAHVLTVGPGGRSLPLTPSLAAYGLLRPGSPALDVDRLRHLLGGPGELAEEVVTAVAGALGSVAALLNPAGIVIGGPWGTTPGLLERLTRRFDDLTAVPTELRTASLGAAGPLTGARIQALRTARESLSDGL
ncbi:MAG: Sugar kinase of the family, may containing an N-terminal domain [Friedmanniella sp.]|nr:Sugar kinase of the family, may containing an N-terminal domain [Friedmanniella sp.]